MTIFSRYVFRQTSSALLLVLLSLTGIVWISLALRELNVVTSHGQSALTLIKMTTLGLPSFVAVITPFALLITAIHTLNRLNSDSEIIVLTASGATAWTIVKPLVTLGLLVVAFISFVNHLAAPWSYRLLRDIVVQVRTDLLTQVIQPGRFSSPEKGLTFHIRERTLDGTLHGLVMHDARKDDEVQSYLAEKGVLVEDKGGTYLFMMDGHILRRNGGIAEPTQIIAFDKYAVDLNSFEKRTADGAAELRPRERYFSELVNPEPQLVAAEAPATKQEANPKADDAKVKKRKAAAREDDAGRLRSELHERFSSALYPLAFVLMAVAMVGQAQSTRQNRNARMGLCFLIGVGLRLSGLAVNNIVTLHAGAVPILYFIPVAAIAVSMLLIVRGTRATRGPGRLDVVVDAAGAFFEQIRKKFSRRRLAPAAGVGR
ncbi:LPS export ABC transporter permease LptF [uncultured Hyphomicrobium sp.]|uniref:LPS export ABC transporter permease LptF n=1 Tax=uncultured Hyphomicrobium sp. TaxID=194373 RepID=UPI0025E1A5CB|nr:LPS export ABC transporter permease LptF [uncultured Hyphomicrobium sp.]